MLLLREWFLWPFLSLWVACKLCSLSAVQLFVCPFFFHLCSSRWVYVCVPVYLCHMAELLHFDLRSPEPTSSSQNQLCKLLAAQTCVNTDLHKHLSDGSYLHKYLQHVPVLWIFQQVLLYLPDCLPEAISWRVAVSAKINSWFLFEGGLVNSIFLAFIQF